MGICHENPWFRVLDVDGYFRIENRSRQVVVLPVMTTGEVVMVKVRRQLLGCSLWELPAGGVDEGESVLAAAKREFHEETGIEPSEGIWVALNPLLVMPNRMSEATDVFAVTISPEDWLDRRNHDSEIETVAKFSVDDIRRMIAHGDIMVSLCIAVLMRHLELSCHEA